MFQKTSDYQAGLMYCIRNDIGNAYFYLMRAAKKGCKEAQETLKELEEKNLLPVHLKKTKSGSVNFPSGLHPRQLK